MPLLLGLRSSTLKEVIGIDDQQTTVIKFFFRWQQWREHILHDIGKIPSKKICFVATDLELAMNNDILIKLTMDGFVPAFDQTSAKHVVRVPFKFCTLAFVIEHFRYFGQSIRKSKSYRNFCYAEKSNLIGLN